MGGFLRRRLVEVPPTLLVASVLIFLLMHLAPGDPIANALGPLAQVDTVAALREEYGLDRPLPLQYLSWLAGVLRGDLGRSLLTREPVMEMLLARTPATAILMLASVLVFVAASFPGGVLAAYRQNGWPDHAIMLASTLGVGVPSFFLAILLIALFGIRLQWLPLAGYVSPFEDPVLGTKHLVMPVITLSTFYVALTARLVRVGVAEALGEDYVRTARAKGIGERRVLLAHAARNGLVPAVTASAINAAYLFGGSIIVEEIFAIPGLGRLLFTAVVNRDFPVIQGIALVASLTFVLSSLVADALVAALDPRWRLR